MKTKSLTFLILLCGSTVMAQICPKTFRACIETTFETANLQDGSISIDDVSGGTAPYSYVWSTSTSDTTSVIDSLSAGNYSVTISDSNNCTYRLCVLLEKDSLPCSYSFANLTDGDTLGIYSILLLNKLPSQTGALIEFYDKNSNFLSSYYTDEINNNNAKQYNIRIGDNYYNQFVKMVVKGVYGSDTSEHCGDTTTFIIENFPCDLNFNGQTFSFSDTIAINNQFLTNSIKHSIGLIYELFDENDNFIRSFVASGATNGSSYYKQIPQWLYYNERLKVTYKVIYNTVSSNSLVPSTDTVVGCDTAKFTVEDYKCDFDWRGTCSATVQNTHNFWVSNWYHMKDAWVILMDSSGTPIDTIEMLIGAGGTRILLTQHYVTNGNSYKLIPYVTYEHYDSTKNILDTIYSCGDTCSFLVDPSGVARKKNTSGFGSSVNSQLTNSSVVYPNPANGILNLDYSQKGLTNVIIQVYDASGKLVKEKSMSNDNASYQINTSQLNNGVYFMKIESPNSAETVSFSVMH